MASDREWLDETDLRILRTIQSEGRLQIVELAERVNLSKSPCLKRLRSLEERGYIKGYHALLDARKLRQGYLVYSQVKLADTTRRSLEEFNKAVMEIPEILSCHMMSGGYDYLLKIRTADMDSYRALVGDVISLLPNVSQTSSFPVMEEVKDNNHVPF